MATKTTVGEAVIKLSFDGASLQSGLSKLGTTAKIGGKIIGAGLAVAATAVTALGTASVKTYAEYEQLVGGVDKLYGQSAKDLMAYAKQSFKTTQLSAANFMKTATSFSASLIQNLGGDTKKAADYTNRAIKDMADNANTFGTDMERIQDAYRGFARGQFNMLDNLSLGYGGTRAEMERLVKDAASYTKEQKELNLAVDEGNLSFSNIVDAISVVQKHMELTGKSSEEAASTLQGSFNAMKASAQDLITGLTDPNADIAQLMDNFIEALVGNGDSKGFIGNLKPAVENVLKGITKLIEKGVPRMLQGLPSFLKDNLPAIIDAAVELLVTIAKIIPEIAPVVADSLAILVKELVPHIPQIIGAFIEGLFIYLTTLWKSMPEIWGTLFETLGEAFRSVFLWVNEHIGKLFNAIFSFLGGFAESAANEISKFAIKVGQMVQSIGQWFRDVFTGIGNFVKGVVDRIAGFFTGLWDGVKSGMTALGGAIKKAFETIANIIKTPINAIINAINGVISKINSLTVPDWVPGIGGSHTNFPTIPTLAKGGYANGAINALIGEAGKEAVIPLERNTDNWAGLLARTLAQEFEEQGLGTDGGVTIYMTNEINNELDADEIGRRLLTSIRRAA